MSLLFCVLHSAVRSDTTLLSTAAVFVLTQVDTKETNTPRLPGANIAVLLNTADVRAVHHVLRYSILQRESASTGGAVFEPV